MKVKDVCAKLEEWAPPSFQESYDNSGLLVGQPEMEVTGVLVSLDCTEEILQEAIDKNCNVVVSHHPVIFGGLKRITGKHFVERIVMMAIKHDIALYAIHTNLDNINTGVNNRIADRLGLSNRQILLPKRGQLRKLVVFCPHDYAEKVRGALFEAGAGNIGNYDECSFNLNGEGTFRGGEGTNAFVGTVGQRHTEPETRIEVMYQAHLESRLVAAMRKTHPYEEVAYDIYELANTDQTVGSGMVGTLSEPIDEQEFLKMLKSKMKTDCIRHTKLAGRPIKTVALCGGSGSFLLNRAKQVGADIFITGDFKYHDFFEADNEIVIADIGHFESEQFTIELITEFISEKFSTFAVYFTEVNTNPINYF